MSYSIVYSSSVLPINLSGPAGHLSYEERHLQDVDQELQNQVGFVAGADGDSWGHEAAARLGVPRLVAADIEMASDFFCFDGVAVAVAGHAGSGDDVFIGTLFQDGVDKHGLGIGVVEGFANDLVVFQDSRYVVFRKAYEVRADIDEGIDVCNLPGQGIGLALS